jgi:iron-sulfur cluster repair protein YtfE (RIC family)
MNAPTIAPTIAPTNASGPGAAELAGWTINRLVAAYPETMGVLAALGLDLCCGGAHPLGEALDRHGHDRATALDLVVAAIRERSVGGAG